MPRICINVPGETPQPYRFELERKQISIGRASASDIQVSCPSVSTQHAEIRRVEGGYVVEDLDSTNGLKLDGTPMKIVDLIDTMQFTVGDVEVDFQLSDEELSVLGDEEFESHEQVTLPPLREKKEHAQEEDVEADDDFEEKPKKKKQVNRVQREVTPSSGGGIGGLLFLILLVALGGVAFFMGLSKRHSDKTGGNLLEELKAKYSSVETPTETTKP